MDDAQPRVQVVEPDEHLPRQRPHRGEGHPAVAERLDQAQKIVPKHLEDHADVRAVGPRVLEPVEQADAVTLAAGVALRDLRQELDLVPRGLRVVGRRLLDFEGR